MNRLFGGIRHYTNAKGEERWAFHVARQGYKVARTFGNEEEAKDCRRYHSRQFDKLMAKRQIQAINGQVNDPVAATVTAPKRTRMSLPPVSMRTGQERFTISERVRICEEMTAINAMITRARKRLSALRSVIVLIEPVA